MSAITAKASRKMKKYAVLTREPRCFLGSFDLSWEQRKFSELVQIERGGSPRPIDDFITDAPNGLNWVKIGDAPTQGNYITKTAEKIRPEGLSKTREVHPGDLILSNSMSFGKPYIMGIDGCIHDGWLLIRNTYGVFDLTFLCHLLGTPQMLSQYRSLAAGSTVNNLNKELVGNTYVTIPSITEQRVLGAYLEQLDNLITLHQRKCALLFSPFQSFISMMFTTSTFSWEQRKLGDVMNVTSVKRIHQSDWTDSGVRFLRARDIVAAAKNEEPDDYLYISKEKYEEYSALSGKVGVSDLLVTGVGTIGVPYLVRNLEPLYFKDGNIIWFQNSDKIDGKFLFYSFSAEQIQGFINESAGIGTVGTYTIESGKKTPISLPNQIEQAKVGEYFQQLDNLITLHQRKCIFFTGRAGRLISTVNKKRITSSWEQRKVGDLLIERNQQAPMSDEYPLMAFIANEGVAPKGERYDRSALVTDTVNKLYKKTEKGDFIYSSNNLETGSIGLNKYGKACISPVYSIFEPTGIADSDFLGRRLVRKDFINAMVKWRQGVIYGQWRIHESDFLKIEITVPSVEEQRKIGTYLDQLDHLITLHQRKPFLMKWRTSDANRNQTNRLVL